VVRRLPSDTVGDMRISNLGLTVRGTKGTTNPRRTMIFFDARRNRQARQKESHWASLLYIQNLLEVLATWRILILVNWIGLPIQYAARVDLTLVGLEYPGRGWPAQQPRPADYLHTLAQAEGFDLEVRLGNPTAAAFTPSSIWCGWGAKRGRR
jgi:hypothetical protein